MMSCQRDVISWCTACLSMHMFFFHDGMLHVFGYCSSPFGTDSAKLQLSCVCKPEISDCRQPCCLPMGNSACCEGNQDKGMTTVSTFRIPCP
eukprot:2707650-Amphidinium_carterae.1